jgi:hypothetical protein
MSFTKPEFPPVDPAAVLARPLMGRMRFLAQHWTDNGFGSPRMVHAIYIAKLVFFYTLGDVVIATMTSGLPAFWHVAQWWNQPIVYQKAILWTVLLEAIGFAGSWGLLAGKVKPMTGGILFWARPATIRLRPCQWVPFTNGDRRNWFDVILYLALLVSVAVALFSLESTAILCRTPCRTTHLAGEPGAAHRADGAAGVERPARQDRPPRRARRAVPAGANRSTPSSGDYRRRKWVRPRFALTDPCSRCRQPANV